MKNIMQRKLLLEQQIEQAKKDEVMSKMQSSIGRKRSRAPEEDLQMAVIISANNSQSKRVKSSNASELKNIIMQTANMTLRSQSPKTERKNKTPPKSLREP